MEKKADKIFKFCSESKSYDFKKIPIFIWEGGFLLKEY